MNITKIEQRIKAVEFETAFRTAFEPLGGVEVLSAWALKNPRECQALLTKVFPGGVFHHGNAPMVVECSPLDVLL